MTLNGLVPDETPKMQNIPDTKVRGRFPGLIILGDAPGLREGQPGQPCHT